VNTDITGEDLLWLCCGIAVVKVLQLYVFDDTDPDESTYLGIAKIPLITLAHDKPIHGTFELTRVFTNNIPFCLHVLVLRVDICNT